jgi:6-phosphogluconolactonase/glucosamine-6-phosphate isomerase/deaminase
MTKALTFTCKSLRYTKEVFVQAEIADKAPFLKGLELAKSRPMSTRSSVAFARGSSA